MSKVIYTTGVNVRESELVDEVYWNENTGDLYVDLDTAIYKYSNVPAEVVKAFEDADSAGAFYGKEIKAKFGPGDNLGPWTGVTYDEVEVKPKQVEFADGGYIKGDGSANFPGVLTKGDHLIAVRSANEPVSAIQVPTFSLKPFAEQTQKIEGNERDYAVVFSVTGLSDKKVHRLKSTSVDEAVETVVNLGKSLDLTFTVHEVTITIA